MRYRISDFEVEAFQSLPHMAAVVGRRQTLLISVNALTLACNDAQLAKLTQRHTAYLDGVGAQMIAQLEAEDPGTRISGADLWLELLRQYPTARIYCIGGTSSVIEKVAKKIREDFPQVTLCGIRDGYLNSSKDRIVIANDIIRTRPQFVFIAMGQPRQELLATYLFEAYPALYAGLGGSFDVYVGDLERAPEWMQRSGMEWLFRLLQEPSRWRRMLPLIRLLPKIVRGALNYLLRPRPQPPVSE